MSVTLTFDAGRRDAYRKLGFWGDASLGDYWQHTARSVPDKIAVVDNHGTEFTYAALDHAASCLASWMLANGIQPGDRVAFQLPGWCEFTVIYLACLKTRRRIRSPAARLARSRAGVGAEQVPGKTVFRPNRV